MMQQRVDQKPESSVDVATAGADIDAGRRVLIAESEALKTLAATLGDDFERACGLLRRLDGHGRAVVSGMGKSGHIARKIAASLASTGTPALFVHPGEASHGDLGMITANDVVIALSNSGETTELADLVDYSRRHAITLIAITGRADGTLARRADVALLLPACEEACPMGLAPTTSTTMMLALGDALAIAVLESKGFTAAQFRQYHPGGRLGKVLVSVADIMHQGMALPLATPDTAMAEVLLEMSRKGFGCVGIVDANEILRGIITDGDLRRHMARDFLERPAAQVMTEDPVTIDASALAGEALHLMNTGDKRITALFVVDTGGRPVGLLHIHDLLRAAVA